MNKEPGEREYHPFGPWGPPPGEDDYRAPLSTHHLIAPRNDALVQPGNGLLDEFLRVVEADGRISERQLPYYRHWARTYLEYCGRTKSEPQNVESRKCFTSKLGLEGRAPFVIEQADHAIQLLQRVTCDGTGMGSKGGRALVQPLAQPGGQGDRQTWEQVLKRMEREIGIRHYSSKTLKTYLHWTRGFARYLDFADPGAATAKDAKAYLGYLALDQKVAGMTQNQAFNALLFLFSKVLEMDFAGLKDTPRAKKGGNVPEVLSREEVERIFQILAYPYDVFAQLLYGCGLRLGEGLALRIQDLDLRRRCITVHRGKGGKSRRLMLPARILPALEDHLTQVRRMFEADGKAGTGGVFLPEALERKQPGASREWPWYWVFPGKQKTWVAELGVHKRFHLHESLVHKAIKAAVVKASIPKNASAHTFRHSYATHLLQMGVDIRTVQEWMGHRDVKTTQIYTQALRSPTEGVASPLDWL